MSAVTPTTREGMVLCVSQLGMQEQASVRCIVLLSRGRLEQSWRVSDISEGADCILQRPQPGNGDSVATLELNLADGKSVLFDVEWPLIEQRLVDALNRVSAHCAMLPRAQGNTASWMSHLISGFGRGRARPVQTATTSLAQAGTDKRSAISGYLRLFGRHDTRQQTSILLVGSPGSGKTTAITTVSTSKVHSTEVEATDTVAALKPRTTIALDYGECEAEGCRIRLYGTPGQLRFAHMIRQTLATCDAVMILADATSPTPFEDVHQYVQLLEGIGNGRPIVVAYTHLDQGGMPRNLRSRLVELLGRRVATIPLDPRDRGSVLRALSLLVNTRAADTPLPGFAHVPPAAKPA